MNYSFSIIFFFVSILNVEIGFCSLSSMLILLKFFISFRNDIYDVNDVFAFAFVFLVKII